MSNQLLLGRSNAHRILILIGVLSMLVAACGSSDDDPSSAEVGALEVSEVWSRPVVLLDDHMDDEDGDAEEHDHDHDDDSDEGSSDGGTVGVVYLTVENTGDGDDRLVSASSDVAMAVELHNVNMVDGVMQMRQVEQGVAIPAGETVVFEPNGLHVMLIGLHEALEVDDTFDVELEFAEAGTVVVQSEVREP